MPDGNFVRKMFDAGDATVDAPSFLTALAVIWTFTLVSYSVIVNKEHLDPESTGIGVGAIIGAGGGGAAVLGWQRRRGRAQAPIDLPGSGKVDSPD